MIFPQLAMNSLITAASYALIAMGFAYMFRVNKFFNISYGAVAMAGAYGTLYAETRLHLGIFASILFGLLIAALTSCLIDQLVIAPLRKRKASPMVLLIASLGAFTIIQALTAIIFGSQFQSLTPVNSGWHIYTIFGATITTVQLATVVAVIVMFLGLLFLSYRTSFGRVVRAIGDDEEVAVIMGVPTQRAISIVFIVSGVLAGMAGIASGFDVGIQPTIGFIFLLKAVIAAIVGGLGTISGALLGAVIIAVAENIAVWQFSGAWRDLAAFVVLILFLLIRPRGIINE